MFTNSKHKAADEALKKGEVDKAIVLYTEALNENPNDCDILSDRGTAFLHKKDQLRSLADFNKAIDLDPNYAFRYAARAFAKQNFGDLDGAVADYKKAVELDPSDAVAENNLGLLLEQQGYKKEAEERFKRADKLSKMEDELYGVMDDLEGGSDQYTNPKMSDSKVEQATQAESELENNSTSAEFKKVFTSRKQFREFVRFIKNGFKLK
jgi:Tfp pilus assembly protein PilF